MSVVTWIHEFNVAPTGALPRNVFRYVLGTSGLHQVVLLALTVGVFLLEVVPLELQRRIVNDLVKHRPFSWVIGLCAVYAGIVLVQGGTKLALNIYRGWSASGPSATCGGGFTPLLRLLTRPCPQSKRRGSRFR